MRFANWLENGQPRGAQGPGTTEAGTYTIVDSQDEVREAGATYFVTSMDEWHKAAYYDPRTEAEGGPLRLRLGPLFLLLIAGPCNQIPIAVVRRFLLAAFLITVVRGGALGGMPPAMDVTAAKRTTQITATRVAGVGQKENPAMPAPLQAPAQLRLCAQTAAHNRVVPQNKVANLSPAVPLRPELKMRLDLYCKKDRSRPTMPMALGMSSSYSIDTSVSSGRTGAVLLSIGVPAPQS